MSDDPYCLAPNTDPYCVGIDIDPYCIDPELDPYCVAPLPECCEPIECPCTPIECSCESLDCTCGFSDFNLEVFYEFFTSQASQPNMNADVDEVIGIDLSVKIPVDGGEYTFEVIAKNSLAFDLTLIVFDTDDFVCSTLVIPSGSIGVTKYELFRFTSAFTEGNGDYQLKITKDPSSGSVFYNGPDSEIMIPTARIKLYKENPTEARIQIPMIAGGFNYYLIGDSDNLPYSAPVGWSISEGFGEPGSLDDFTSTWAGETGDKITTIWDYSSEEFETMEQVTFSVAVDPQKINPTETGLLIVSTWDSTGYDFLLYTAPPGTSPNVSHGIAFWVDENTSFIDVNAVTFTPIPSTYLRHTNPVIGETTIISGIGKVTTPTDCEIHLGGVLYGFLGSVPGDQELAENWGGLFSLSLSAGQTLFIESISYFQTGSLTSLDVTVTYKIVDNTVPDISVALRNITTDTIVSNSTLVWPAYSEFARKETIIELAPDCSYETVVKCPGQVTSLPGTDPELIDAQLWLDLNPITKITTYNRLGRYFDGDWDSWVVPLAWGSNCDESNLDEGSRSLGCRMIIDERVFASIGEVFLEATGFISYDGELAECYKLILDDTTDGDATGSGANGSDVSGSELTWSGIEGFREKKRSSSLTLVDGHIYSNRLTSADSEYLFFSNGFLVCRYTIGG